MNDPYFEMLIHEYQEFYRMIEDVAPSIEKEDEALLSWAEYTRYFMLDLIAHVDPGESEHRAFVNNASFPEVPEMTINDYQLFFKNNSEKDIDSYLYANHCITRRLLEYDSQHHTDLYSKFIDHYCVLAEIFSDQSSSFRSPVERFVKEYKACANDYLMSGGSSWGKQGITRSLKRDETSVVVKAGGSMDLLVTGDINSQTVSSAPASRSLSAEPAHAQQYTQHSTNPEIDSQFWLRILIPAIAGVVLLGIGFSVHSFGMDCFGIIALIVACFGLKANKQRCPKCRAWNSLMTVRSEQVGQRKVKVRRNLNSTYFRSSGNTTFGTRQVFVNADEYTYNELYRCSCCGYEIRGTRRAIDDGIR